MFSIGEIIAAKMEELTSNNQKRRKSKKNKGKNRN